MDIREFDLFRAILSRTGVPVSGIEYTQGNCDNEGNPIPGKLPTVTTDLCEIGLHGTSVYFVVIIDSRTFGSDLFERIRGIPGLSIYGLEDFKDTLYPKKGFNEEEFFKKVAEDEYLQLQFDHEGADATGLAEKYLILKRLIEKSGVAVVNQMETNLADKNTEFS